MLIGSRAASVPLQLAALLLGILLGLLLYGGVIGAAMFVLPVALDLPLRFLTVAFCAYYLAAPATWRGLARRSLLVVSISQLGFAVLGYLLAFLLTRGMPIPGSMPALVAVAQAVILVAGIAAAVGFVLLRDRKLPDAVEPATVAAAEVPAAPSQPAPTTSEPQGWQG